MKILSSTGNFIKTEIRRFEDGELMIKINEPLENQEITIIHSISTPVNDNLMALLLAANAAKEANKITALIPYLGYSRQDREGQAIGLIIKMLKVAGITRIITLDIHSKHPEIENIDPSPLWQGLFIDKKYVVVSPDSGGRTRAENFSKLMGYDLAIINKTRDSHGKCTMSEIQGNVAGRDCIIIDDIIDSGGTIYKAADLLIKKGALSVKACATHPVFSKGAIALIENSPIEELYVSNSIAQKGLPPKIRVVDIENILMEMK